MHSISAATLNLLQNKKGLEPLILIEIFWSSNTSYLYCDKDIDGIDGKILSLGELESVINVQGNSTSSSISITLADTDGEIKNIFDQSDIHKRKVKIYQWFAGLPLSEKILLFIGYLSSPIIWNERERTISFDVVTKVEDQEIGFSIEEGIYTNVPDFLIGKAWPLGFGKCVKVPAIPLNEIPSNVTATIDAEVGVVDPSLRKQIGLGRGNSIATMGMVTYWLYAAGLAAFHRDFDSLSQEEESYWNGQYEQWIGQANNALQQIAQIDLTLAELSNVHAKQKAYMKPSVNVTTNGAFPQGVMVPINLKGTTAQGFFSGNTFNFTYIEHPSEVGINQLIDQPEPTYNIDVNSYQRNRITKLGFYYIESNAEIVWRATSDISYIVNLLDCQIRACYSVKNGRLTRIPSNYIIDKGWVNFGTIKAKVITIGKQMSDGHIVALPNLDEGWESDVYVTFDEQTVGSNTVDQIQYLIETYSDLTCDTTTFNYVRAKVNKWPSNFAFLDRPQVLDAIRDMAWQARCAIWIVDEVVYIKYLPEEVTEVATLDEDDIEEGSFEITCTETEEIVTKFIAMWRPNYYNTSPSKLILRYNTHKYGVQAKEFDFYIYNNHRFVLKMATFWIIRYANTWKKLKLKTFLENIGLESFDTIKIDLTANLVATSAFKALVETCSYNPDDNTVTLELWTPILLGTMQPFVFAWPANITVSVINAANPDPGNSTPNDGAEVDLTPAENDVRPRLQVPNNSSSSGSAPDWESTTDDDAQNPPEQEQELDEGAGIPDEDQITPNSTEGPNFTYDYPDYDPDRYDESQATMHPICAPGQITGGGGNTYTADFYPDGFSGPKIAVTNVRQLQIDGSDQIPVGTWCLIARTVRGATVRTDKESSGPPTVEYFIQVPVWM